MPDQVNQDVFDDMVRQTIARKVATMRSEQLVDALGFLIQMERRSSAEGSPAGLYPIS